MKVLVIGGGGREHAIAYKLAKSHQVKELFVAPGNAGTASIATNVAIECTDIQKLVEFAQKQMIDLTIVGMDNSLELGVADAFEKAGLVIFGPTQFAAQIETSKAFSKQMMKKLGIPTAEFEVFQDHNAAFKNAISRVPVVIKADGLALGKGVYICKSKEQCKLALDEIMVSKSFGQSGDTVVVEDYLDGYEMSLHAFCDGKTFSLFPVAQDHKPIFDGDIGPNTGGMGAVAPVNFIDSDEVCEIAIQVIQPVLDEFVRMGHPFVGVLYPGLRMTSKGMRVLEYNARFGDPEAQVYMRLLETDLVDILLACVKGGLADQEVRWSAKSATCIVMASGGYPESSEKGVVVTGIDKANQLDDIEVFQAGTIAKNGKIVTNGGRVLSVTATGTDLNQSVKQAYKGVEQISFDHMQYRSDIGKKALY